MRRIGGGERGCKAFRGGYYFIGLAANATVFLLDAGAAKPQDVSFGSLVSGLCSLQGLVNTITDVEDQGVAPQSITTRTP